MTDYSSFASPVNDYSSFSSPIDTTSSQPLDEQSKQEESIQKPVETFSSFFGDVKKSFVGDATSFSDWWDKAAKGNAVVKGANYLVRKLAESGYDPAELQRKQASGKPLTSQEQRAFGFFQQEAEQEAGARQKERETSPEEKAKTFGAKAWEATKAVGKQIVEEPGTFIGGMARGTIEEPELLFAGGLTAPIKAATTAGKVAKAAAQTGEIGAEATAISAVKQKADTGRVDWGQAAAEAVPMTIVPGLLHVGKAAIKGTPKPVSEDWAPVSTEPSAKVEHTVDVNKPLEEPTPTLEITPEEHVAGWKKHVEENPVVEEPKVPSEEPVSTEAKPVEEPIQQELSTTNKEPLFKTEEPTSEQSLNLTESDFHNTGRKIYREQGEEAALNFAKDYTKFQKDTLVTLPSMPKTQTELGDSLFTMSKLADEDKIKANQDYLEMKKAGATEKPFSDAVYEQAEGTASKPLAGEHQGNYDKYIRPLQDQIKALSQKLMDAGVMEKQEMDSSFLSRMLKPKKPEIQSLAKDIAGSIKETLTGGNQGGMDVNVERVRGAGKDRSIFVLETRKGKRDVVQIKDNKLLFWKDGKIVKAEPIPAGSKVAGEKLRAGDTVLNGTLKQAKKGEIEQHSSYTYHGDLPAVLLNKKYELQQMLRAHETLKALQETPLFKETARKLEPHEAMPEGYSRPEHIEKLQSLKDYVFPKRMSEIISDYAQVRDPTIMSNLSSIIVKNMMMNPLPHMFNEMAHLYMARGLTGWTMKFPSFVGHLKKATDSVLRQDQFYSGMIKDGASLLAPSARAANKHIENALWQNAAVTREGKSLMEYIARKTGRTVSDVYNGISARSSAAMWTVRDIMYQAYIRELMQTRKLSMKDAIAESERHMPNYRLPSRVGEAFLGETGSRGLSKVLNNPSMTVFSRYHYGLVRSIIETNKDLAAPMMKGLTKEQKVEKFKHAADTYAAVAIAMSVVYPLVDSMIAAVTGNEEAHQRKAGPFHILSGLMEVAEGEKQPQAVLASLFTVNPALLGTIQLAIDKNIYSGRPIYNIGDPPEVIAEDIAKYIANQMPQVSTMNRVADDKGGGAPQWIGKQLDIEMPSDEQVRRQEKFKRQSEAAARGRERKRNREE